MNASSIACERVDGRRGKRALRQREEEAEAEEKEEEEEETRALDYTRERENEEDCSFSNGSRDEKKTCTRRGGPFSALNVAICGPLPPLVPPPVRFDVVLL